MNLRVWFRNWLLKPTAAEKAASEAREQELTLCLSAIDLASKWRMGQLRAISAGVSSKPVGGDKQ